MTLVSEGFDMQVVGVVDVLADLQHRGNGQADLRLANFFAIS